MSETQNTPPHAELHITIETDLRVDPVKGLHNGSVELTGCAGCIADAIADQINKSPAFKDMIYKAIFIATMKAMTKGV